MSSTPCKPLPSAIFHLDLDNFYASCQRLFEPRLRGQPVIVLSNNDGNVIARSEEAKALGVAMGAPLHAVRDLVRRHAIRVYSSNFALYGDLSARLGEVLEPFFPQLEAYSIDEWFGAVPGEAEETALLDFARNLVGTVHRWLGLPVSVGIAPTKVLAKVATRIAKKQKVPGGAVALLDRDRQTGVLADLATADVWGIAGRWSAKLGALGIGTALQLREADPPLLRSTFGVVMERIAYELHGLPCSALEEVAPPKQQIVASRSFGRPVTDLGELREAVAFHVTRAAVRQRRQRSEAGGIQVSIGTNPFNPNGPPYHGHCTVELVSPAADTRVLIGQALRGLDAIYRPGNRYKKAGVMLLSLTPADRRQGALFQPGDPARSQRLMTAIDRINHRMGRGTVRFGTEGFGHGWAMRQARKSPAYTTRWGELPQVR